MTSGSLISFVTSLLLLYKPVKTFGNTLTNIQTIFVAMWVIVLSQSKAGRTPRLKARC
jgi:hypothetical protein